MAIGGMIKYAVGAIVVLGLALRGKSRDNAMLDKDGERVKRDVAVQLSGGLASYGVRNLQELEMLGGGRPDPRQAAMFRVSRLAQPGDQLWAQVVPALSYTGYAIWVPRRLLSEVAEQFTMYALWPGDEPTNVQEPYVLLIPARGWPAAA